MLLSRFSCHNVQAGCAPGSTIPTGILFRGLIPVPRGQVMVVQAGSEDRESILFVEELELFSPCVDVVSFSRYVREDGVSLPAMVSSFPKYVVQP